MKKISVDPQLETLIRARALKRIMASTFEEQRKIIDYNGAKRRLAVHGTRRTAKTSGVAIRAIKRAFTEPGYKACFIALTYKNVQEIFYENCIKEFLGEHGVNVDNMPASLPWHLPNGSMISGFACDNSQEANAKIRGTQWDDIFVDEAGHWRTSLKKLIRQALQATLTDRQGNLFLLGTPGDVKNTFWHQIVMGLENGYDLLKLHWRQNPYVIKQRIAEDAEWAISDPDYLTSPEYRREFDGEWDVEESLVCYRYSKTNTAIDYLPGDPDEYYYGIGVDVGHTDQSSISVGAWPKLGPKTLYIIDLFAMSGLMHEELGVEIQNRVSLYHPIFTVVDCSAATFIDTLNRRFRIDAVKSDSRGKRDHMELMNADLRRGMIQILKAPRSLITKEWDQLVWDRKALEEKQRWEEASKFNNHASDATLYMWHMARHWNVHQPTPLNDNSRWVHEAINMLEKHDPMKQLSQHKKTVIDDLPERPFRGNPFKQLQQRSNSGFNF